MKLTLALLGMLCLTTSLASQRIINQPINGGTNVPYSQIQRIELNDTTTVIEFKTKYFPGWWIRVSQEHTYIQDSKGGEKLYVKSAEGLELNTEHWTPETGVNSYSLIFPPVDDDVEMIDFIGERWRVFDIQLRETEMTEFKVPVWMLGNWLSTDGSNQWELGVYEDVILYNNKVWSDFDINDYNEQWCIELSSDDEKLNLYIEKLDELNLAIGTSSDKKSRLSKEKTIVSNYSITDNSPYSEPLFQENIAIYQGYINGYHPKMGETGIIYVNNLLTSKQDSRILLVKPDGSFYIEVPLLHPQGVYIRLLDVNEQVFLEPGKTLTHFINLEEFQSPYRNRNEFLQRNRQSLFMGDLAGTNRDLSIMSSIQHVDYNALREKIIEMTPDEYYDYYVDAMNKEILELVDLQEESTVCSKALQIAMLEVPMRAVSGILEYNMIKEHVYRQQNNIPNDQRNIDIERHFFDIEKIDFIKDFNLNSPISLVAATTFSTFINRIEYYEGFNKNTDESERNMLKYLLDVLEGNDVGLNDEELSLVRKLMDCFTDDCLNEVVMSDSLLWEGFYEKNSNYMQIAAERFITEQQRSDKREVYEEIFGVSGGIFLDLTISQRQFQIMESRYAPLTQLEKENVLNVIEDEFIREYILAQSDMMEKELEETRLANKTKTGYVINKTPEGRGEKLFEAIIENYRGKVVYVDFWATWCGPCRSGMERIKPLKEELKDEDVVFVYITNPSSPQNTWELMIPDVKGEHYRVSQDEWNYFANMFNISGIPHYLLVDRDGKVVKNKIYMDNESLKQLFDEYL